MKAVAGALLWPLRDGDGLLFNHVEPDQFQFGGGASETVLSPFVLVGLLLAIVLLFRVPRRKTLTPFLLIIFLVPLGQQFYFLGLHWLVLRIVVLAACVRMLSEKLTTRSTLIQGGIDRLDWSVAICVLATGISPLLRMRTAAAIPLQLAAIFQGLGAYCFLRYAIRSDLDIVAVARILSTVALALGLFMGVEQFGHLNVFGYTGSGPIVPVERNGLVRAQACFAHPILAGCFGATVTPLFFWLWKSGRAKTSGLAGIAGSFLMTAFSASSTSALALIGGIGVLFLFPIRRWMRQVRWAALIALVSLSLVMQAPVWFLISRINVTGSSDAWQRAMLIDNFIRHFGDWWLIGADPSGWGVGMWDLCNRFVAIGETGGLLAFSAFISVFVVSFGRLGRSRLLVAGDKDLEWLVWSLGAVVFAHMLAFFGVSYFDQTNIWWYATLAMVSAAVRSLQTPHPRRSKPETADEVSRGARA